MLKQMRYKMLMLNLMMNRYRNDPESRRIIFNDWLFDNTSFLRRFKLEFNR